MATAGRFTIVRELGRGGFATVFLAQQHQPNRRVAIKLLSPALLDSDWALEHFRGESQKIAEWRHQAVVTIYEVHEEDALLYFVMSYVEGASLHELLQLIGPLPISIVRSVLAQVGSALQYAHRQGVTHRDIKPHNILVDTDGGAVVTDFGIAKQAGGPSHTATGMIVGTAPYMAPEQCESGKTSAASDQYALGIVAYEMLLGAPPFTGAPVSVLMAHLQQPIPSIREHRPDCPPELEAAVLRMLAKKPSERFDSVTAAVHAAGAMELADAHPDRRWFAEAAYRLAARQHAPVLDIVSMPAAIEVGERIPIGAQARTTAGEPLADVPVEWSSEADGLVSLDVAEGVLTGLQPGRATVVVRGGGVEHHIELEVRPPEPGAVVVQGPEKPLRVGDLGRLSAIVTSQHGASVEAEVHWQSTQPQLATIDPDGVIQAHAPGWVHVTASAGNANGELWVEIAPPLVDSVRITGDSGPLELGQHRQLSAIVLDAQHQLLANRVVRWSSSDPAVAVVSATGRVTACAAGRVVITAECDERTATLSLLLREAPVTAIEVVVPSSSVHIGDRIRLHATVRAADGRTLAREVSWQSREPGIASVDADGTVTALAPGVAVVAALCEGVLSTTHLAVVPDAPHFSPVGTRGPADLSDAVPASSGAALPASATDSGDAGNAVSSSDTDSARAAGVTSWLSPSRAETASESTSGPAAEAASGPATGATRGAASGATSGPATDAASEAASEAASGAASERASGAASRAASEAVTQPPAEPSVSSSVEPPTEASAKPANKPSTRSPTRPATRPAREPRVGEASAASERSVAPAGDPGAEPAAALTAATIVPSATSGPIARIGVRPAYAAGALAALGIAALAVLVYGPGSTDGTVTDSSGVASSIASAATARASVADGAAAAVRSANASSDAAPTLLPPGEPAGTQGDAPVGEKTVSPLVLSAPTSSLTVGDSLELRATRDGRPVHQLSWRSTNQAVATVTATGIVRSHAEGRVAIVATSEGTADTVTLRVQPRPAESQIAARRPNEPEGALVPPRVDTPVRTPANPPVGAGGVTPTTDAPAVAAGDQLRQIVDSYATALRRRSLEDAVRLYPSMSQQERDGWLALFDFARDLQVDLRVEAVSVDGASASARVDGEYRYTNPSTKRPCQQPTTLQMRFARAGDGWRITGIDQQQGRGRGC